MTKKRVLNELYQIFLIFKVSNSRDYRDLPFDKDTFDAVTSRAMFQKTAYRYESARHPLPGSFADEMINRMFL